MASKKKARVPVADEDDAPLSAFAAWCDEKGFRFHSKVSRGKDLVAQFVGFDVCVCAHGCPQVRMTAKGVVSGRGMVATGEIKRGEVLFAIPRSGMGDTLS
jgi:hypothetical protein